jgi:hypothetical protein
MPNGTGCPSICSISRAMRSPIGTPRLRIPTIIRSSSPRFFSTTSIAMRRIARFIRAPSNNLFFTFIGSALVAGLRGARRIP